MPVEKSRFPRHIPPDALGSPILWDCPGCGGKNEGRRPEQGCVHCGAGVPGTAKVAAAAPPLAQEQEQLTPEMVRLRQRTVTAPALVAVPASKVYRLLEYTLKEGGDLDAFRETLRRSLVGQTHFRWGTLTAVIVDDVSPRQQDLIGLGSRQPGVWLGQQAQEKPPMQTLSQQVIQSDIQAYAARRSMIEPESLKEPMTEQPNIDQPPAGTPTARSQAKIIVDLGGYALAYTLASALQMVAEEVDGNIESHKMLSKDECLALAAALLEAVPGDWEPERTDGTET